MQQAWRPRGHLEGLQMGVQERQEVVVAVWVLCCEASFPGGPSASTVSSEGGQKTGAFPGPGGAPGSLLEGAPWAWGSRGSKLHRRLCHLLVCDPGHHMASSLSFLPVSRNRPRSSVTVSGSDMEAAEA